jgi:hypothetical protein
MKKNLSVFRGYLTNVRFDLIPTKQFFIFKEEYYILKYSSIYMKHIKVFSCLSSIKIYIYIFGCALSTTRPLV